MWIFLNDAMLSVVAVRGRSRKLLVRARCAGDIERVFPRARVRVTPVADYRFRTYLTRRRVARAIARELEQITYPNFKASVRERDRHDIYTDVWRLLSWWQRQREASVPRRHPQLVSTRELEEITR